MKGSSTNAEDYLKCINEYMDLQGYAALKDIALILGTVRQTVLDEIKILMDRGLVQRKEKGKYELTKTGMKEAFKFLRKHRVAEILLWKGLGMKWSELDDQAMGIEHGMTEEIIEKVCQNFGCIKCPHGNYVPDKNGNVKESKDIKVSEFNSSRKIKVSRVIFESPDILKFMENNGLYPGSNLIIVDEEHIKVAPDMESIKVPENFFRAVRFTSIEDNQ